MNSKPHVFLADRSSAEPSPRLATVVRVAPMVAGFLVALVSAFTLTAYDKPLDRQALTPSVMEFMDGSIQPVSTPWDGSISPHAMLLRYDLDRGEAPVIASHPWRLPAEPNEPRIDSML